MLFRRDKLRKLREEKKFTQEYMANKLGITRVGYGYYESGKRGVDLDTVNKLGQILDVHPSYFLDLDDVQNLDDKTKSIIDLVKSTAEKWNMSPTDPKFQEIFSKVIDAVTIARRNDSE
ncbi:helix-turn-helix domain-containing protein [Paenibacillus durus]|uniref:HTH cro/C1-type domain-containing protein n=1 Tax=Paenibacillus durus ATCC 35681 TaxID=1333534 RepID=A0A0F7FCL4_PAEDU|nr:helix-turn-helix transcriptional regulator [Paenibacillus durus]AKG36140.1 hypothetical protein VK70_17530 [Paenibacillus durus ATCC 35681]